MRDLAFTDVERLHATVEADEAFQMDEEAFRDRGACQALSAGPWGEAAEQRGPGAA